MKRNIKNNFNIIFCTFIISGLFFGSIGIYAGTQINSRYVLYNNATGATSTNVQDAIDEVYNKTNIGDATSSDILTNKTALVKGKEVLGSMPDNSGWSYVSTDTEIISIPKGYHDGTGYVDTNELLVEIPLKIMDTEPFIVQDTVTSKGYIDINCPFEPSHMTIAYRNSTASSDRIGLGLFDFVNKKRYLYWAPTASYQKFTGADFSNNITMLSSTKFRYTNSGTTDHYIIFFIYKK